MPIFPFPRQFDAIKDFGDRGYKVLPACRHASVSNYQYFHEYIPIRSNHICLTCFFKDADERCHENIQTDSA
jgi:hypothetical protein